MNESEVIYIPGILVGILAFLIPCYVFGENAEHIGEDKLLCGLAALGALLFFPFGYVLLRIYLRSRIRLQKGISVC